MPNRILIIDDDKDLCRLLQESLRQMDAEADVCYSGNVGISFMQKREYHLVVLDIFMPGMDGILKRLRRYASLEMFRCSC